MKKSCHPEQILARAAGKMFYSTGEPCKRGHLCRRYASDGQCEICREEYYKYYRSKGFKKLDPQLLQEESRILRLDTIPGARVFLSGKEIKKC